MASTQLNVYENRLKQYDNGNDTLFDSFQTEQANGNEDLNISTIENSTFPSVSQPNGEA